MADFFDPAASERWGNPEERAHKMFVLLTYLDFQTSHSFQVPLRVS